MCIVQRNGGAQQSAVGWVLRMDERRLVSKQETRGCDGIAVRRRHRVRVGQGGRDVTHTLAKRLPALGPEKRRACGLAFTWRAPTFALGAASIMTILPSLRTYIISQWSSQQLWVCYSSNHLLLITHQLSSILPSIYSTTLHKVILAQHVDCYYKRTHLRR